MANGGAGRAGSGQGDTCCAGGRRGRAGRGLTREDRGKRGVDGGAMARRRRSRGACVVVTKTGSSSHRARTGAGCGGEGVGEASGGSSRARRAWLYASAPPSGSPCYRGNGSVRVPTRPPDPPLPRAKGKQSHTQVTLRLGARSRALARAACSRCCTLTTGSRTSGLGVRTGAMDGGRGRREGEEEEEERTPPDCASKRLSSVSPI
ncbi:hypothetical protein C8Q77DRAFT_727898 [Trametes polyzona]|nr:hypothetical protein C8Q77DRAFT_727898 [Trametes polyzona]